MHFYSGLPWGNARIDITYFGYSQTATEQRPSDRHKIRTAIDGKWNIDLWKNQAGDYQSYYEFKFPNDKALKIYLTNDLPSEIEFSQLLLNGTPPTAPEYPSLIALIDERLASSGVSFPTGGQLGQVLAIAQATPRVLGWADSRLVFTQAVAATNWAFNHTLNRVPVLEVTDLVGNRIFVETQATVTQAIVRSESPITGVVYLS
jgi:hypothetical protein